MKKAVFCGALIFALVLTFGLLAVTTSAAGVINRVTVTGIDLPVDNARPDTTASVESNLRVHSVEWYDETEKSFLESNDTFQRNHVYTVIVWVQPVEGKTLACQDDNTPSVTATILGQDATVAKAFEYKAWAMADIRFTFPALPERGWVREIDIAVTAPEAGKALSYAECRRTGYHTANIFGSTNVEYNAMYKNGIAWGNVSTGPLRHEDNPVAAAGTVYRVAANVIADSGYTFAPNVTYKINGKTAYGNLDYAGTVAALTYDFPPTVYTVYRIDLELTAPKTDELPQYPKLSGTGYASTETESATTVNGITYLKNGTEPLSKNGTFAANTNYTVKAELKAATNYVFHEQVNVYINGAPATVTDLGQGVIAVSANFSTGDAPVHNHIPSGWISDGKDHYKVCTDASCRQEIAGTRSAHTGGTATCQMSAKCTVCGCLYGENADHAWGSDWAYTDKNGHAYLCTVYGCGVHGEIQPHQEGPAGTPDAATVCAHCGYIMKPAANHVHDLKKIPARPATCMEPGCVEHYACSGCSDLFKDEAGTQTYASSDEVALAPLGHKAGAWSADGEYHWRTCETCDEALEETKMAHGTEASGKCDSCGYDPATGTLPPEGPDSDVNSDASNSYGTDSAATNAGGANSDATGVLSSESGTNPQNEESGMPLWGWIALAVGVLAVIAACVFFLLRKKKSAPENEA